MSTLPKILVTGANGQLGKELKELTGANPQFEFVFLTREDMPVQNFELVRNTFSIHKPAYCINCAAYTAVDNAESEKELAFQVNGEAPGVLAAVADKFKCRFIQVSTDYVFDGQGNTPYREDAATNPQNVYGASKLEGEKQVKQFNPASIIIRTSWVYSALGSNFVRTMLRLMSETDRIKVVNDQLGSPTYGADLAEVILRIISSGQWKPGIYHYSNEGVISWFDFATVIKELSGKTCIIDPIPTSGYPTPAKRPMYSVLDTTKIREQYGIRIKYWKNSLEDCLKRVKKMER